MFARMKIRLSILNQEERYIKIYVELSSEHFLNSLSLQYMAPSLAYL